MARSDDRNVQQQKQTTEVPEGPTHPTGFRVAPEDEDRRFVLDQTGELYVHDESGLRDEPFLEMDGPQEAFTTYFEKTFNRGQLQRAQKMNSLYPSREHVLPLPPKAGGEFCQAPVYNTEVEYDVQADEWQVTDDTFTTGPAIYLANQDVWTSNWNGGFYHGRGVLGQTDEPIS